MKTLTDSSSGPSFAPPTLDTYEEAAKLAKLGVWEFDLVTEKLTWSAGVYEIFGIPLDTSLSRADIVTRYFDESRATMEFMRAEAIRTGRGCSFDAHIKAYDGQARWVRLWLQVAQENGSPTRIFGAQQDVTAEREMLDRLRKMAENDALTGLGNRGLFDAQYREMIGDPLNYGGVAALVLIDLDQFKQINDKFGHIAGDECLRRTADRLRRIFADSRLVARIGGDEFAVLMRAPMGEAQIRQSLQRAAALLAKPVAWGHRRLEVGASIGATIIGRPHRRNLAELFAEADSALYAAKMAGRRNMHIFGELPVAAVAHA